MTTVPERPDQPVEVCDLCGTRIAQDSGHYERVHDPASDRDIVLTACDRRHLDDLVRQYTQKADRTGTRPVTEREPGASLTRPARRRHRWPRGS